MLGVEKIISTHSCTISNRINGASGCAFNPQVRIRLNSFSVNLVRQQVTDTLGKWVHSYSSGPENEVRRNCVLLGLFSDWVTSCVEDWCRGDSNNTSGGDQVNIITFEPFLKDNLSIMSREAWKDRPLRIWIYLLRTMVGGLWEMSYIHEDNKIESSRYSKYVRVTEWGGEILPHGGFSGTRD